MATMKVRNISGGDRDVPQPDGSWVTVPAGHQAEFEEAHARSLIQQPDAWEKVTPAPAKKQQED